MENPYNKCKAKGGIENCRKHRRLAEIQTQIDSLTKEIISTPDQEKLNKYFELRELANKLQSYIKVAEYNDLTIADKAVDSELSALMKDLVSKRVDKLKIEDIDWNSYVKAAILFTSAQSYGTKIERLYCRKRGYLKVNSGEEKGDAYDPENDKHIEIKFTSLSNPLYQADIVQIRPHHALDSYHIIVFNKDTSESTVVL